MKLLTPIEACDYLAAEHNITRSPRTLANLRSRGGGPKYFRPSSNEVRYSPDALDDYVAELLGEPVGSTAEEWARLDEVQR
jgi:hypothetical protein